MRSFCLAFIPVVITLAACGSARNLPEKNGENESGFQSEEVDIGYGSSTRQDLGFAVNKLEVDDITVRSYQSIAEYLRSRVPGIEVNYNGTIRIRGQNALIGPSEALIVVDGVICDNINSINPSDVHSVQVLKDGSASIYGSRGADGVVLITTKAGYQQEQDRIAARKAEKEARKAAKKKK